MLLIAVQEYIKRIPHLNCVSGVVVHTGSSAFLWHKEERNIVTPVERFLKWKSRNPNSPEYEEYILKRRVKIRHMNRDEAEHELKDFDPKPLNLVSVDENTPCGHYIDMTFAV